MPSTLLERMSGVATRLRGREYLANLNLKMHAAGAFPGHSWRAHVDMLQRLVPEVAELRILDYGCGPLGGLKQAFGDKVIAYDPFVEDFAMPPWNNPIDLVFSSDVLEHMTVSAIGAFLRDVDTSSAEHLFLNISTRPAHKRLPNSANAHLTVKSADWWLTYLCKTLGTSYTIQVAQSDLLRHEATFYCCRTQSRNRE